MEITQILTDKDNETPLFIPIRIKFEAKTEKFHFTADCCKYSAKSKFDVTYVARKPEDPIFGYIIFSMKALLSGAYSAKFIKAAKEFNAAVEAKLVEIEKGD